MDWVTAHWMFAGIITGVMIGIGLYLIAGFTAPRNAAAERRERDRQLRRRLMDDYRGSRYVPGAVWRTPEIPVSGGFSCHCGRCQCYWVGQERSNRALRCALCGGEAGVILPHDVGACVCRLCQAARDYDLGYLDKKRKEAAPAWAGVVDAEALLEEMRVDKSQPAAESGSVSH